MRVLIAAGPSEWAAQLPRQITEWGYEVTSVTSGRDAFDILQQPDPPQLLLAAWDLPDLGCAQLCRGVARPGDIPATYAILLTPQPLPEDVADLLHHGADDFIFTPPDILELQSRLAAGSRIMRQQQQLKIRAKNMADLAESRFRQLIHADRLAALGTMAAGVAHEISTPLAFICSSVELLEMYWDDLLPVVEMAKLTPQRAALLQSDVPKIHQTILRGVERISGLVSTLNTFCRRGEDTFEEIDLHQCLENARQLCVNMVKYTIDLKMDLDADLPPVCVRPRQIEQVILNLIKNATDAIGADDDTEGTLRISTRREDGFAVLAIEDSGPGIPPEHADKIWEAFFTTKAAGKGTGLGLPITRGIIEDHGGTILVDASDLGGARFTIRLPLGARPAQQSDKPVFREISTAVGKNASAI